MLALMPFNAAFILFKNIVIRPALSICPLVLTVINKACALFRIKNCDPSNSVA